ncbi:MAG: response regulator transcription factor [Erysipelotrichaceae bacterium]
MYRLLIIEDEKDIAESIATSLANYGFETRTIDDFSKIMETFKEFDPHMVLLDIKLPYYDGYHYCMEIRKISKLPIIFISSASDNMNIIMAMNMGGDDFVIKPFEMNVLIAKIMAHLRRCYDFNANPNIISINGINLNINDSSISYENRHLELSKNEFRILLTLVQNKGKIVSREKLMEVLWQSGDFVDENTLNVNINRLRKKLETIKINDLIQTKFGMGYMI